MPLNWKNFHFYNEAGRIFNFSGVNVVNSSWQKKYDLHFSEGYGNFLRNHK